MVRFSAKIPCVVLCVVVCFVLCALCFVWLGVGLCLLGKKAAEQEVSSEVSQVVDEMGDDQRDTGAPMDCVCAREVEGKKEYSADSAGTYHIVV